MKVHKVESLESQKVESLIVKKIKTVLKYLKYRLFAKHKKGFGIHSPFLYRFVREVLYGNKYFYAYDEIAELRYDLLDCDEEISVKDFGAGSKKMKNNIRKVRDIAKYSAVSEKFGEMLFRTVEYYKPKTILELGTSLGIGTLYLAKPDSRAKVYTIEGCPETAKKATENFKELKAGNIEQIIGNIDEKLPDLLKKIEKLDLVYFDGNHQKEATLSYFYRCLQKTHNDTIFYFDDIHWSEGMTEAWNEIKKNEKVTLTVDLFFGGFVFFKKELSKEDFIVKF
ncbi:MAG: class I SAM-dependent methyltransferase [Bacteroidales bacterium]|nr:class I SAM-dependent methyltransferase [Bacteroidales bacterium]